MSLAVSTPLPALVLAAFAAIAMSGCAVSLDFDEDVTKRTEARTVPVGDLTHLDVSTANGTVSVATADVDDIEIVARLQESDRGDAEFSVDTDDDVLSLVGECDGGWLSRCSVGFDVTVPAGLDVDVRTDNGPIFVDGVAGRVDLETDNGAIEATTLEADDVAARTDNGRILLQFDAAPTSVEATSDNGAIAIRFPDDGADYDVDASSDNGPRDIAVRTDPTAERRIVVGSDNGAIDVEYDT
jgi:DUF4097 and DUF4098 domain-containing protein YvlB